MSKKGNLKYCLAMIISKMPSILLVGSGLTSAVTAHLLKLNGNLEVTIWDKARGCGGRMSTSRSPLDANCTADLGAQYISATPAYSSAHKEFYNQLIEKGVLQPLDSKVENMKESVNGTKHYVTPQGVSSIVKHFVSSSGCRTSYGQHVSEITEENGKWLVKTQKGVSEVFDSVVLTMPVPQVFQLSGSVPKLLETQPDLKEKLQNVQYSSRYALGLFYDDSARPNLPWDAAYLDNDPVFRFVCADNAKRGKRDSPAAVVFHTSVPFGVEHVEKTAEEVEPLLLEAVARSFPDLPKPAAVKCQKWRFSQVTKPFEGEPGFAKLSGSPLLLVGGDGFVHSNFDGCVTSAEKLSNAVLEHLGAKL